MRLDRFDVRKKLSFIVTGAAGVKVVVLEDRSERWRAPFSQGLSRKNIIVAIDNQRGTAGSAPPRGIHDRIAPGRNDTNAIQASASEMPRQPGRATPDVGCARRLRTNARKAKKFLGFGNELRTMDAGVV